MSLGRRIELGDELMHHAEPVPPVVHFGEAFQEIACGGLGLLELAGSDEVGRGVGGSGELLELVGDRGSLGEARKELGFGRTLLRAAGRDPFRARGLVLGNDLALGRLLLGLTALLDFLPLPQ